MTEIVNESQEVLTGSESFIERRKTVVDRRLGLNRRRGPGHRRSEERRAA